MVGANILCDCIALNRDQSSSVHANITIYCICMQTNVDLYADVTMLRMKLCVALVNNAMYARVVMVHDHII